MQGFKQYFCLKSRRKPCEVKYVNNHLPFSAMLYKFVATYKCHML